MPDRVLTDYDVVGRLYEVQQCAEGIAKRCDTAMVTKANQGVPITRDFLDALERRANDLTMAIHALAHGCRADG